MKAKKQLRTALTVLAGLGIGSAVGAELASRVAADFADRPHAPSFVHYAVPPMSNAMRLPDAYPEDGEPGAPVRIVLAKDEYEPGAFLVYGLENLGKVRFEVSDLKQVEKTGGGGERETGVVFPRENVDLKMVKVWYQNANSWFSYFGDNGRVLCPELLLNDEDLVRVDTVQKANYARLKSADGTVRERWINPPEKLDKGHWGCWRGENSFSCMKPEFCDAETLQPVTVTKDAFTCLFLTVHATKDTPAGLYRGEVKVIGQGQQRNVLGSVPVCVRVLDFVLPKPGCYSDVNKPFLVGFYAYECLGMIMEENGGDRELAERQYLAVHRDYAAHGQDMCMYRSSMLGREGLKLLELDRQAGFRTDAVMGQLPEHKRDATPAELDAHYVEVAKEMEKVLGHRNIYAGYGDEPGPSWLVKSRPVFDAIHKAGMKIFIAGSENVFRKTGYAYDWINSARTAEDGCNVDYWNKISPDVHVAWYSQLHVGAENPSLNRRQNGLTAFLTGYSALCNYAHHFGQWNDRVSGYRPMVFAYGHHRGVIDTLQWEGFREGIDDIRYATELLRLARPAAASKTLSERNLARQAIQYLASVNREVDDLDTVRAEMIGYILRLKKELGK